MADDPNDDADNPEWTEEDFARARPASEILPAWAVAALTREASRSMLAMAVNQQNRLARGWRLAA
jgi:hypothetical protein